VINAGVLAIAGCAPLPAWLVPGAQPRSPHEVTESSTPSENPSSVLARKATPGNNIQAIDLAFDVVRVDLPISGVRHSRKVWNHVDELRLDPQSAALLARNGLRIGAASPDAWPAIRAIFEAAEADIRRDQLVAQRGLPLTIHVGSIGDSESVFSYGADQRLVGKTFPAGDKLVNLDYLFHPELGGNTEVRVSFEIRHDRGVLTWEQRNGVVEQVPDYDRHVFADLSPALTLNAGEFLVLGLSDQAKNEYLLGSRFLTRAESGKRYETLLCLTPQPYQAQGAKR